MRSFGGLILLALPLLAAGTASGAARKNTKKLPPPGLPAQVAHLGAQLYALPLDESESLTGQIQKLVLEHMGHWIAAHPAGEASASGDGFPYDVRVRHELENVFSELRYPIVANVAAFAAPFGHRSLIGLGYELGWTDFNGVDVVAVYESGENPMRPLAVAHPVPATNLRFQVFDAPAAGAGQCWFLAYGTRQGKSNPRLSAVLYAFDGGALKPLWKRVDLFDGKISFRDNRVMINYLNEAEFQQAVATNAPVVRHEAAYHIGPQGMVLDYDH